MILCRSALTALLLVVSATTAACNAPRVPRPVISRLPARPNEPATTLRAVAQPAPVPAPEPPDPARCVVATPRAGPTLFIGSEHGVREVNRDGSVVRVLTRTAAARPRLLPDGTRLVFVVPERAEVRTVALDDCREDRIATLPRGVGVGCGGSWSEPYDIAQELESDRDVAVDPASGALCLDVMDRNENMASVRVVFDVDIAQRRESHFIAMSASCGQVADTDTVPAHRCLGVLARGGPHPSAPDPSPGVAALPFRLAGDRVVRGSPARELVRIHGTDVSSEQISPSGRWELFSLNRETGDYIYRQLLLLDRRTGDVFRVQPGAWPAPIPRAVLTDAARLAAQDERAAGETTLRWLSGPDALIAETTLITPGRGGVPLEGHVAY